MVFQTAAKILAGYKDMGADAITPETTFSQLELDSLDQVELIMSLEETFNVQLDVTAPVACVGDLVELIEKRLAEGAD